MKHPTLFSQKPPNGRYGRDRTPSYSVIHDNIVSLASLNHGIRNALASTTWESAPIKPGKPSSITIVAADHNQIHATAKKDRVR
jgi:hypothetical protein